MFDLPLAFDVLLSTFTKVMLPAYNEGELSQRFASGKEAIRPVVFSHGLSGEKENYTAIYLAMASHGYLVVAINH